MNQDVVIRSHACWCIEPYNTGKDFIYDDNFSESANDYLERSFQKDLGGNRLVANLDSNGRYHSNWLSMMYSRLRLARNLLANDGVICMSIDDSELSNLISISNEIFGEENFINNISVMSKSSSGASGGGEDKRFKKNIEYLLFYSKRLACFEMNIPYMEMDLLKYIEDRLDENKTFAYTSILKNEGKLEFYKTIKDGSGNDIELFEVKDFEIKTIHQVMKEEELSRKEVYLKYFENIFTTENAQTSIRTRVDDATKDDKFYIARYKPISGRNKGLVTDVGFIGSTKRLVSFLKNVAYKKGNDLFKIEKIGTLWNDLSWSSIHLEGGIKFNNGKKPVKLIKRLLSTLFSNDYVVLDFFAGSSTSAHAVLQLNSEDGGNRKFIMVQLPEEIDESTDEFKAGYTNISELSKERIRRAGKQILESDEIHEDWNRDIGFRVLKVAESNMKDVYYKPQELTQSDLLEQIDNVKEDVTPEDLLFQVMLDWGLPLSLPVHTEVIEGKTVYFVAGDALIACFDAGITESLVKVLAEREPLRILFRDNYYASNDVKINAEQLVKQLSPNTELKSI